MEKFEYLKEIINSHRIVSKHKSMTIEERNLIDELIADNYLKEISKNNFKPTNKALDILSWKKG
jgi:hypothetical protein